MPNTLGKHHRSSEFSTRRFFFPLIYIVIIFPLKSFLSASNHGHIVAQYMSCQWLYTNPLTRNDGNASAKKGKNMTCI